jgi:pseudouridylate synthase
MQQTSPPFAQHLAPRLALESTLLLHGVPAHASLKLAEQLASITHAHGVEPCLCAVVGGKARINLSFADLAHLLESSTPSNPIAKLNSSSLAPAIAKGQHGATTVSTTIEIAAAHGIRVFSTGGIGGVHRNFGQHLDISTDLIALSRWPVAVVTAGCKSILDVHATREMLETLGVPVIGFKTDDFPAFYQTTSGCKVDARFDSIADLANFASKYLAQSGRGIVVCNPIPVEHELPPAQFDQWLARAISRAEDAGAAAKDWTPAVLSALHEISQGKTLAANIELVKHNVHIGAKLAKQMGR